MSRLAARSGPARLRAARGRRLQQREAGAARRRQLHGQRALARVVQVVTDGSARRAPSTVRSVRRRASECVAPAALPTRASAAAAARRRLGGGSTAARRRLDGGAAAAAAAARSAGRRGAVSRRIRARRRGGGRERAGEGGVGGGRRGRGVIGRPLAPARADSETFRGFRGWPGERRRRGAREGLDEDGDMPLIERFARGGSVCCGGGREGAGGGHVAGLLEVITYFYYAPPAPARSPASASRLSDRRSLIFSPLFFVYLDEPLH